MQRYLIFLFSTLFIPLICTVVTLDWIGSFIGTTLLPRTLANYQHANKNLVVLPGDLKYWAALKLPRIEQEHPEIVLIGPSRASQVRGKMFEPYTFYNAALTAWNLDQYEAMMAHVTRVSKPRVVILSLDYFLFSERYAKATGTERSMFFDNDFRYWYESMLHLLKVIWEQPSLADNLILPIMLNQGQPRADAAEFLGIDAIRSEAGFRWDGSFKYSPGSLQDASRNIAENKGILEAIPGSLHVDDREMATLARIAALAREQRITLIGIQFPMWHATVDVLDNDPAYRPYAGVWREFESQGMKRRLEELGIAFFDLSHDPLTANNQNFSDAAHPSEIGMLRSMLSLLGNRDFARIFPAINAGKLQNDLNEAEKKGEFFYVYRNDF